MEVLRLAVQSLRMVASQEELAAIKAAARHTGYSTGYDTGLEDGIKIGRAELEKELMEQEQQQEQTPFGYWHQGSTYEESEFYLASESGDVSCERCVKLYAELFPQQKPLSDAQIDAMWKGEDLTIPQIVKRRQIVRSYEAAHGITGDAREIT